jgi:hypothetical protein
VRGSAARRSGLILRTADVLSDRGMGMGVERRGGTGELS